MAVIQARNVRQDALGEEVLGAEPVPSRVGQLAPMHHAEQRVLLGGVQRREAAAAVPGGTLGLDGGEPLAPGFAHVGHVALAEAVARIGEQLGVEQRHQRHRRAISRLRQDALADRIGGRPLGRGEESRLPRDGKATVDDPAGDVVPGRGVPLVQHVVSRIARRGRVSHQGGPPAGRARRGRPAPTR